ncbi:porin family protein [Mesonia sp. K7]|uniref:porin family protein n=1 Tax=Mesonia sp. K7 TaxID=2218606 RepID=UPI000DA7AB65|nr:porin family protein [Mesonia sp. K7]PZD79452.1 OmpW family protein [Mesonia sp. K7]
MKKLFLTAIVAVFGLTVAQAQETSFGVMGGLTMASVSLGDADSESETGFHIGLLADLGITESFSIQPEATYSMVDELSVINLNVIGKYYVTEGLNIQLGPQIGLLGGDAADAWEALIGEDDFTKLNLQLAAGLGYDFTENFFAQARYGFQLNDHYTGDVDGADLKLNTFNLSVGYKF